MDSLERKMLWRAMKDSENYVLQMWYRDAAGKLTQRTVSPVRFNGKDRFTALCLSREEPRQFYLERCSNLQLIPANDVLMPVPILEIEP